MWAMLDVEGEEGSASRFHSYGVLIVSFESMIAIRFKILKDGKMSVIEMHLLAGRQTIFCGNLNNRPHRRTILIHPSMEHMG